MSGGGTTAARPSSPPTDRAGSDNRATGAALPLALLAGAGVALQAFVNGRLGDRVGSALVAALLSFLVGLAALVVLMLATGSLSRARRRWATGARPAWWHLAGGIAGAGLVTVSAYAAPRIGVALLTVGLVAGQVTGSLAVDAVGLGPLGRRPASPTRLLGAGLAIVAVVLSALGQRQQLRIVLLLLVLAAGVAVSFQQAANGRLQQVTGEAVVAATVNFAVGIVALVLALVVTRPHVATLSAPLGDWTGGLLGVVFVVVAASTVRRLGVLLLTLAAVAGQSVGALALDAVVPASGRHLTPAVVAGVVLTLVAVAIGRR